MKANPAVTASGQGQERGLPNSKKGPVSNQATAIQNGKATKVQLARDFLCVNTN